MDIRNIEPGTKRCPYCAELILVEAIKCKHCGEMLNKELKNTSNNSLNSSINIYSNSRQRKWSPGLAAVLSFFIPGLGQLYKGNIITAILWFLFVILGYIAFIIPGLVLHLICILMAFSGNPYED